MVVSSIDDNDVCFCINGLKSYKEGYYVYIKHTDVKSHAICLIDWCNMHPEDANPTLNTVHDL